MLTTSQTTFFNITFSLASVIWPFWAVFRGKIHFWGPNWVGGAWYGIFLICEKPTLRAGLITVWTFYPFYLLVNLSCITYWANEVFFSYLHIIYYMCGLWFERSINLSWLVRLHVVKIWIKLEPSWFHLGRWPREVQVYELPLLYSTAGIWIDVEDVKNMWEETRSRQGWVCVQSVSTVTVLPATIWSSCERKAWLDCFHMVTPNW